MADAPSAPKFRAAAVRHAVMADERLQRAGHRGARPRGVRGRLAAPTASACRSAVCSKRAFRSPRFQFAKSDWQPGPQLFLRPFQFVVPIDQSPQGGTKSDAQ